MTLTCWTTATFYSVVCDSMDHWFAPVKTPSSPPHAYFTAQAHAPSSAYAEAPRCFMFIFCGPVLTKHGLVADEVRPQRSLISRVGFDKASLSGVLDAFTYGGTRRPLMWSRWRTVSRVGNIKDMFPAAVVSRPCMDKRPAGLFRGDLNWSEMVSHNTCACFNEAFFWECLEVYSWLYKKESNWKSLAYGFPYNCPVDQLWINFSLVAAVHFIYQFIILIV